VLGLDRVIHEIVKSTAAWKGTAAEQSIDLSTLSVPRVLFEGSAREAASAYPKNANATVATSLAGIGLGKTAGKLIADPRASVNGHRIVAVGGFGKLEIILENNPLATNPKSSELTALSLVRLIEQQYSALSH